jgi:hypothetical protein
MTSFDFMLLFYLNGSDNCVGEEWEFHDFRMLSFVIPSAWVLLDLAFMLVKCEKVHASLSVFGRGSCGVWDLERQFISCMSWGTAHQLAST